MTTAVPASAAVVIMEGIARLIRQWLKTGVMEDGTVRETLAGTPQGGVISPLLANIYLHYAFDLWVQHWRKQPGRGEVCALRIRH